MDTDYCMGISCCIRCEILDMEGLCTGKPWAPPAQDAEWKTLTTNRLFLLLVLWGGYICMRRSLIDQGDPFLIYIWCHQEPCLPVYTAAAQHLGIPYQPMVFDYAWGQYGELVKMPKYGVFSGEPTKARTRCSMISGSLRWRSLGIHMGRPW